MDEELDEVDPADVQVDPSITPQIFTEWRNPRFGCANPERMNNPFWEWMIRTRLNGFQGNEKLNGPDSCTSGPVWCFTRFGQSRTLLPDSREIFIAGEHEDSYDADFYIYNDLVVKHPDGRIDIFGYPKEVFPPTDFHSATLIADKIILIGSLGYHAERKPDVTQILTLDSETMQVSSANSTGKNPGWISRHRATLAGDGRSIVISGGEIAREQNSFVENLDEWSLDLSKMKWQRLTFRKWPRWSVYRKDHSRNSLWTVHSALNMRGLKGLQEIYDKTISSFIQYCGHTPDLDLAATLFRPDVPHEPLERSSDEWNVRRIKVNGVTIRYQDEGRAVVITAEGDLDASIAKQLASELQNKLAKLENREYEITEILPA